MSYAQELMSGLAELRGLVEERMLGTCRIDRVTGSTVGDDGKEVVLTETVYEGKCYSRYPGLAFESVFDLMGVTVSQSRLVVRVPFGPKVAVDDVVTILSEPHNPPLVGTVLPVRSIDDQSQSTAQRLLCADYQKGVKVNES